MAGTSYSNLMVDIPAPGMAPGTEKVLENDLLTECEWRKQKLWGGRDYGVEMGTESKGEATSSRNSRWHPSAGSPNSWAQKHPNSHSPRGPEDGLLLGLSCASIPVTNLLSALGNLAGYSPPKPQPWAGQAFLQATAAPNLPIAESSSAWEAMHFFWKVLSSFMSLYPRDLIQCLARSRHVVNIYSMSNWTTSWKSMVQKD